MSKTFIASFVGRLAAALFIAICVFLGFGPKEWAAFVISGRQWVTPAVAQWAFLGLGALVLGSMLGPPALRMLRRPQQWLTLFEAAEEARKRTQNTAISGMADVHAKGSRAREIGFYAELVARVVDVYGEVPPSNEPELIDAKNEPFRYIVEGREISVVHFLGGEVKATHLKVKKGDLPLILAEMEATAERLSK